MKDEKVDDPYAARMLVLWLRAKRYGALPVAGGLLRQPEVIMQALDVIEDTVAEEQEQARELEEARRAARSEGGHHFAGRKRRRR